jgi:hypothetical protein
MSYDVSRRMHELSSDFSGMLLDAVIKDPLYVVACYRKLGPYYERESEKLGSQSTEEGIRGFGFLLDRNLLEDLEVVREAARRVKDGDTEYVLGDRVKIVAAMSALSAGALMIENDEFST